MNVVASEVKYRVSEPFEVQWFIVPEGAVYKRVEDDDELVLLEYEGSSVDQKQMAYSVRVSEEVLSSRFTKL